MTKLTPDALAALIPAAPKQASIREAECIGCTKCLPVCPVDAIIGGQKHMHTVLTDQCIGCALCVAACPVDCIDMNAAAMRPPFDQAYGRYQAHHQRLLRIANEQLKPLQTAAQETKAYLDQVLSRKRSGK